MYDVINIFCATLAILTILLWIDILARTSKKVFIPPQVKKRQMRGFRVFLAISCFAFGYVINSWVNNAYNDNYTMITKTICFCIQLYGAYQFLIFTKEKEIIIRIEEGKTTVQPLT